VRRLPAAAKLNLALVVGAQRPDGKHEVVTLLQRVDLVDRISLELAPALRVTGFESDTLVRAALERFASAARVEPRWSVRIWKRIPVAAGLGGGSSDAATALRLANETLAEPLEPDALAALAAELGADVPFFLIPGPQLGEADGTALRPVDVPQDYWVVLLLPDGVEKASTASVYAEFDERVGAEGFPKRRAALLEALAKIRRARDLASLPPNDLASSPLAAELVERGAFRADVSGAGPTVYGLFTDRATARRASHDLQTLGRTWLTAPTWYF